MGRKSNKKLVQELSKEKVSKDMTKKQLQSYIRKATTLVNKTKKQYKDYENLKKSYAYLVKASGVKEKKGQLGLGFSKKVKADLLKQARLLQSHLNLDVYTRSGEEMVQAKTLEAYETYKQSPKGKDISFDDYINLVGIFNNMDSGILAKLGSDQVREYYLMSKNKGSSVSITDFIVDTYNRYKGTIKTKKTMLKKIKAELQSLLMKESEMDDLLDEDI